MRWAQLAALNINSVGVHCTLHQEALQSKSLQMKNTVSNTVNFIQLKAPNHRQFVWSSVRDAFVHCSQLSTKKNSKADCRTWLALICSKLSLLPFSVQAEGVVSIQIELIELQAFTTLKQKFEDIGVLEFRYMCTSPALHKLGESSP